MEPGDIPEEVLARVSRLCLALPETHMTSDRWATTFRIRRRIFVYLFALVDPQGNHDVMLVCRADPEERAVLLAIGHPFFGPRSGRDRLGIVIEETTDWDEIAELVTESYRLLAPKKLAAGLDAV